MKQKVKFVSLREVIKFLDIAEYTDKFLFDDDVLKFKVNEDYLRKIKKRDLYDPLLMQILPLKSELGSSSKFYLEDPLQESMFEVTPGLTKIAFISFNLSL